MVDGTEHIAVWITVSERRAVWEVAEVSKTVLSGTACSLLYMMNGMKVRPLVIGCVPV